MTTSLNQLSATFSLISRIAIFTMLTQLNSYNSYSAKPSANVCSQLLGSCYRQTCEIFNDIRHGLLEKNVILATVRITLPESLNRYSFDKLLSLVSVLLETASHNTIFLRDRVFSWLLRPWTHIW